MAERSQHVHDSCVVERRLRPIYDWLDVGQNKKALQEVEKVLRKSGDLQCARALRALACFRLGREAEALALLDVLTTEEPSDEATLQVMSIAYREAEQLDKVCKLYEAAVKKEPGNEELHSHLFMSYVRVGALEQQQRAAMALYKLKPKNPYYLWAVMSIVLQAQRGVGATDNVKRGVLLSLAQRMVDKLISTQRLEAEQEVSLYALVLQLQGLPAEALRFLRSPPATRLAPRQLPQAALPLLRQLGRWPCLARLTRHLLKHQPDRWDYYTPYFEAAFKLFKTQDVAPAECPEDEQFYPSEPLDDSPEKCHTFLMQLIESGKPIRGPRLARLELYKRLRDEDIDAQGLVGDASELLVEYFLTFGHKACSVSDMRPYLCLVAPEQRELLAQRLMDTVGISAVSLPQNEEQMQRHICSLQLSRCCGRQARLGEGHARALVAALALHCQRAALHPPRSATERAPSDPYCLLTAHLCWDLARKCSSSRPLIEALCLLEYVLENSPSNFHCKLLCIKFYHFLGCGGAAQVVYESLDVKHVQLDSLGHVHCARLGGSALYKLCTQAYEATQRFFMQNYKDSIDHLTFSYKFGSFTKLEELMEWRERLHSSLHRITTGMELAILNVVTATTHAAALKSLTATPCPTSIKWEMLSDNRDLGVYTNWDPPSVQDPEAPQKQYQQDKDYTRLKSLIVRCLQAAAAIPSDATLRDEKITQLQDAIREFDDLGEQICSRKVEAVDQASPTGQLPPKLIGYIAGPAPFRQAVSLWFSIVLSVARAQVNEETVAACQEQLEKCARCTEERLKMQREAEDPHWVCRETLEIVVNYLEVLSIACFCVGVCSDLSRSSNSRAGAGAGGRGARRGARADPPEAAPSPCRASSPAAPLQPALSRLASCLQAWLPPPSLPDIAEHFASLTVGGSERPVAENLRRGHELALKELQQLVQDKQKYLSGLHL